MEEEKLTRLLNLERIDRDIFRSTPVPSLLPRTFGGQVASQSLMAATNTVDADRFAHSLHGYFLRGGMPSEPTIYVVQRIRDGGSFTTRGVSAIQNGVTIFTMTCSFQITDTGVEHQDDMPDVPGPQECSMPEAWKMFMKEWPEWEVRQVPQDVHRDADRALVRQRVWIKHRGSLPDGRSLHIGGLTYLSDMTLLMATRGPRGGTVKRVVSLDHAVWIKRSFRVDEWLLFDQISPSAQGGRALVEGRLFDQAGNMVASVAQEGGIKIELAPTTA